MRTSGRPTVVAVGLGPAGPEHLTPAAVAAFAAVPSRFVRTARHPAAEALVAEGAIPLDSHYEGAERFEDAYAAIVETLVAAARAHGRVVYGVPGSPLVAESTVVALRADDRVDVEIVAGMSFLDLAWERLGVDPFAARARLVDAARFAADAAGDTGPILVGQAWSRPVLSEMKVAAEEAPERAVILHHLGLADEVVVDVAWEDLDRTLEPDHLTSVWVPTLAAPVGIELLRAVETVRTLRTACPWDAEQTHRSLARHLLEETYETLDAIDRIGDGVDPDPAAVGLLEEELGDVLCQVLFHATIAAEEGLFNLADVARRLDEKLVHRHPHVFAGAEAPDADEVLAAWEIQKVAEKGRDGLFDGIPLALPSLALVAKYERKASAVGLGTRASGEAHTALVDGVRRLIGGDASGVGALLVELARFAASAGADPEEEVRRAAGAFRTRFEQVERWLAATGRTFGTVEPSELAARFAETADR